jgi:3'(2'), 5'-bisphosphate nucleotidase
MILNKNFLNDVINIGKFAGNEILKIYTKKNLNISYKNDSSPLTFADLISNKVILSNLKKLTPKIRIISEESVDSFIPGKYEDFYWCIDPLDGTKEFINKNGEFTVNIALIHKKRPVLGVIHIPTKNISYAALKSFGAFRIDHKGSFTKIHSCSGHSKSLRIVTSRSHLESDTMNFISINDGNILKAGSSLKFTLLAEGSADLYPRFSPTMIWDTAAGDIILEEAGGIIYDLNKKKLKYDPEYLKNPKFIARCKNLRFKNIL